MLKILLSLLLALAIKSSAAEVKFNFADTVVNESPKGFKNLRLGGGPVGEWKVVLDDPPVRFQSFTPQGAAANHRPVLAQVSNDKTDERYCIFLYDQEIYNDFTFTTKIKMVAGVEEQMAGIVFRAQDERNFYVLRANAKNGNVRFYTVKDGLRTEPIGNNVAITTNVWHELQVECRGNRISCSFNGQKIGNYLTDNTFSNGKIGFWTKSDAVSHFTEPVIVYTPKENLAQSIIEDAMKKFPRLVGIQIYAHREGTTNSAIIAATDKKDLGKAGDETQEDILKRGNIYQQKGKEETDVLMPLHDRNGEIVAVTRVTMTTFWGQTEKNALARALPIIKYMESKIHSGKDLTQ